MWNETMRLHGWLMNFLGAGSEYVWIFHGVITVIIASVVYFLQRKLSQYLLRRCQQTSKVWDDALVDAASLPLSVVIWVFAVAVFGQYTLSDFGYAHWSVATERIRIACILIAFLWFLWQFISQMESRLVKPAPQRKPMDSSTVFVIGRFSRIALVVVGGLVLLDNFGIPITGLLAFGGGGAIVMGIAAQQLLANWFGGLMIFLDKPFKIGDWIQSPDKDIEGRVTHIGWRTTEVMSLDRRPLYIPNALFNQIIIRNPQRMTHRKIDVTIGIRYEDAALLVGLNQAIESMLRDHSDVDHKEDIMVHLVKLGDSSLDINITCLTRVISNPNWRILQQDIFLKILDIVREHKVELGSPSVVASIPNGITIRGDMPI